MKDSNQFVKTTRNGAVRCTSWKDIKELITLVGNFKSSCCEIQENRIHTLIQMSDNLPTSEEGITIAKKLKISQDKVNQDLDQLTQDLLVQLDKLEKHLLNKKLIREVKH